MGDTGGSASFENVACPFCGLLCDDLAVTRTGSALKVTNTNCEKAVAGFERAMVSASVQICGQDASLNEAVATSAELIKKSKAPLYGGLATDVDGMRAAMALADRTGGIVDHALSGVLDRNLGVLQSAGWIMSTLTETRNRADVVVIVGSDVHKLHPRFFERIVCAQESMFDEPPSKRTVIFIGQGLDQSGATGPRVGEVVTLPCPPEKVDEVLAVLLARLRGHPVTGDAFAGVSLADIDALSERLRNAAYSVMVWAPAGLATPQPDLVVHSISEIVKNLNETTRGAGLSLGGNEGATTATSVCGWQSGYSSRVSFASGAPEYDPFLYSIDRKLAEKEGDLLVWVASFSNELGPPDTDLPLIVLGTPGLKYKKQPDVFIPVGTPGVDHRGQLIRCDGVVSLPLHDLGRSQNPSAAEVLSAIEAAL